MLALLVSEYLCGFNKQEASMKKLVSLLAITLGLGLTACGSDGANGVDNAPEANKAQAITSDVITCYNVEDNCPAGYACINHICVQVDFDPLPEQPKPVPEDEDRIRCDEFSCECDETTCNNKDSCWQVANYQPNMICVDDGRIIDAVCEGKAWTCGTGGECDVSKCHSGEVCKDGKCVEE